jgi:hypothetical protein
MVAFSLPNIGELLERDAEAALQLFVVRVGVGKATADGKTFFVSGKCLNQITVANPGACKFFQDRQQIVLMLRTRWVGGCPLAGDGETFLDSREVSCGDDSYCLALVSDQRQPLLEFGTNSVDLKHQSVDVLQVPLKGELRGPFPSNALEIAYFLKAR